MTAKRARKIAEEIKRIASSLLLTEIKDPRLPSIVSVTNVEVTNDLSYATIFVSAIGTGDVDQDEVIEILSGAKGYFRKEIGNKLHVHSTPEVIFEYDDSILRGMQMDELLKKLNPEDDDE